MTTITTPHYHLEFTAENQTLLRYSLDAGEESFTLSGPTFCIEGQSMPADLVSLERVGEPVTLPWGVTQYHYSGQYRNASHLSLAIILRVTADNPVVRFRYALHSERDVRLSKTGADHSDDLIYTGASFSPCPTLKEIRFSEFSTLFHTFCLTENVLDKHHFENGLQVMGPMLVGSSNHHSFLLAYEHGSQVPDAFLCYDLHADKSATLRAVKGNYYDGQIVGPEQPFLTPWMQVAVVPDHEDNLAHAYRSFVLNHLTPNRASRQPYIFYNTWNFQERNKWWYKNQYLDSMNAERILAEIEVAHKMGIDVFVLDTGWYEKTGDWQVSTKRFPDGLAPIKAKLDSYGIKLGLWFNPTIAALSSRMHQNHQDCLMTWNGEPHKPHEVWETEASQGLCLVSRYADAFADELIRLYHEVGVIYFKWDAIGQYGCDSPHHNHGTQENTLQERRDSYAFQLGGAMAAVVDKLCAACPDAIVDFDITEGGRTVGLQFLAAGKYFLINNGPYSHDYNMPVPADGNVNLFFFPGPARTWICRAPLGYDRWIPSVLFLTHYLPDDPASSQWINIASLVLGQNGIWGDLLCISPEGVERFGTALRLYKQVRDDITASSPVRTGTVGGSPEVHEKIHPATKLGVVCIFASASGHYTYVTAATEVSTRTWHNEGVSVTYDAQGRARIDTHFDGPSAKIVLFGVLTE